MSELERAADIACQVLVISKKGGGSDHLLWQRAQRLVRNVEFICQFPELSESRIQIDRFCLICATYFNDAGLASRIMSTDGDSDRVTLESNSEKFLQVSADIVMEKLAGHIEIMKIEKISKIITESISNLTAMTEAMILSDARNLDDMGAAGIFREIRRCAANGKGEDSMVRSWQRKLDYGYWQARLKDSIRFEPVRKLAQMRLDSANLFIEKLKLETEAADVRELLLNSTVV